MEFGRSLKKALCKVLLSSISQIFYACKKQRLSKARLKLIYPDTMSCGIRQLSQATVEPQSLAKPGPLCHEKYQHGVATHMLRLPRMVSVAGQLLPAHPDKIDYASAVSSVYSYRQVSYYICILVNLGITL